MRDPSKLSALPTELVHDISGRLDLEDLLSLCRTSRQMHAICLQWIYRVLTLDSPVQVLKCCRTVVSRKNVATAVRELKINPRLELKYTMKSFCSTFGSAIQLMKNLELLDVANNALLSRLFCHLSFTQLTNCTIPHSSHLFQFLRINPTITRLVVIPSEFLPGEPDYPMLAFDSIHMPRMESFQGPAIVACSVLPNSRASRVMLCWEPRLGFERVLSAAGASKADVVELGCVLCFWDPLLLAAIVKHAPRLKLLHIQYIKKQQERQHIFSAVENTLHSLPCLLHLRVMEGDGTVPDRIHDGLESEFAVVRKWGEMFPNIISATFMTATPWTRFRHRLFDFDVWYAGPVDTPDAAKPLKWWLTKVLMSPELPDGYSTLANCLGVEGLDKLKEAVRRDGVVPAFDILCLKDGQVAISLLSTLRLPLI
ncbi:hypothetical protein C8R47DRAFT_1318882 [Mycena vitilis]|nr:hypothetical protein C8R47DRAFT_1318882 [Mycena vitilis]